MAVSKSRHNVSSTLPPFLSQLLTVFDQDGNPVEGTPYLTITAFNI